MACGPVRLGRLPIKDDRAGTPATFGLTLSGIRSCSKHCAKPHFRAVELAQLGVAKEDPMHVLIHQLKPDLFIAEDLANKNPALMPADVSAVVHSPGLE